MIKPETDYIDPITLETLEEAHLTVDNMLRKAGVNVPKDITKPYPKPHVNHNKPTKKQKVI